MLKNTPNYTMKKLLLILSLVCISFTTFAADLNPFAYNLNSVYNEHAQTLTINFTLNAPASYVKLAISNGTSDVWTKEYEAADYQAGQVPKATYTETINTLTLPQGENLTWRVDVKGDAVAQPTFAHNKVKLDWPTSVDIDNNPENENFGTVFVVEALPTGKGNSMFISKEDGAGLYILNADGTARPMPNRPAGKYGYNGGRVKQERQYFNGSDHSCFSPYRVRVSDDGRIFISSMNIDGEVLWEADPLVFSRPDAPDWETRAVAGWTHVMSALNENTVLGTEKRNCSSLHTYCGIYHLYEGNAKDGKFIAGPNIGFDVRGSGENLKLLMLAGCKDAIVGYRMEHYYCDEYDLGNATMWNTPPSRRIFKGYVVNYSGAQVQYDGDGNVWLCQHRAQTDTARTLAKFINADNGKVNIAYDENPKKMYRRCGAIRFNEDFTQVVIASNANPKAGKTSGGGFTVYPFDRSTGEPVWNQGLEVNTKAYTHFSLMDFAWDYAGNLYIAADAADGSAGDCVAIYAMPHAADRVVSTPAASKYAFTVNCQTDATYQVTTICNPSEAGTITCSVAGNTRAAGMLTLESCTELTVTATPEDGHKFINWTDGNGNILSTETEYSLYVTEDITLQANFEYATYTGIVWKSLFLNGKDIADESATHPGTNERLWRLMQREYGKHYGIEVTDYPDHTTSTVVSGSHKYLLSSKQLNIMGFDNNHTGSIREFISTNPMFVWLGNYILDKAHNLSTLNEGGGWAYYTYMFMNRTDYAMGWVKPTSSNKYVGEISNWAFNGSNGSSTGYGNNEIVWDSFIEYGKPKHWRPYWAEHACNLPMTMKYSDYMPTIATWNWKNLPCPSGSIAGVTPSDWYKWNVPANNPAVKDVDYQKYFILAWRKGSPTAEEIVHHVYESNMELHASYVLKNIDEEDRVDVSKYDASNDDVIQLMLNRHWVNLNPDPTVVPKHDLTVTRKLQAGMFNTICLPFRVDLTTWTDYGTYDHPLKGAEAYRFAGTTTSTYNESGEPVTVLNFEKVTVLEPGVPYLIKLKEGNADVVADMPFMDVACYTSLTPSVGGGLIFQPTINPTEVPAGSLILVANDRLALTTSTGEMMGMRGYFMIDPSNPLLADDIAEQAKDGRVYLSFKKPTTTSLPMAPEAEQQTKPQVRKIMYDGKIYILRGDEVYTITGHRVK